MTCGVGDKRRSRIQSNVAKFGGKECEGSALDTQSCNIGDCPENCAWGEYTEWSTCSKSCGGGQKTRSRSEVKEARYGGTPCEGPSIEEKPCNTETCRIDCKWDSFGAWSSCSKSCGEGEKRRERPRPSPAVNGGKECEGSTTEIESCNLGNCPINCMWGEFGEWSSCSKPCGEGEKSRTRSKLKEAENGGNPCYGDSIETESCNRHSCPIDCRWNVFGEWSLCSKSCGEGEKSRVRSKLNSATNGGKDCMGSTTEMQVCNLRNCPIDCEWGQFGEWSTCSKSCGGGEKSRTRSKTLEASNGGTQCNGESTETESCNAHNCPIDCKWNVFGEWSLCSKSCGEGEKSRLRSKQNLAKNGGKDCVGSTTEIQACNLGNCPINCEWGHFGEWSACSKSCGGGEKSRVRSELKQAENGGAPCTNL